MQKKTFQVSEEIMATQGQRFAHYILDLIFEYVLMFTIFIMLAIIARLVGNTAVIEWMGSMNDFESIMVMIVVILFYCNATEILFSRTIAKFITGTIVVLEDGSRPDRDTILIRSVCRLIPFDHFSFLGTPARGWHDSLSHTYVVNKKMLEAQLHEFRKPAVEEMPAEVAIEPSNEPDQTA